MFDIGGPELLVIILGAIILFGPKKIPEIMRSVGKGVSKIRAAQIQFKQQMNDIQSELDPDAPDSNDSEFKVVNPNKLKKEHFEKNRENAENERNGKEETDKEENPYFEKEENERIKDLYNLDVPEKDDEKTEDKEKSQNEEKSADDKSNST